MDVESTTSQEGNDQYSSLDDPSCFTEKQWDQIKSDALTISDLLLMSSPLLTPKKSSTPVKKLRMMEESVEGSPQPLKLHRSGTFTVKNNTVDREIDHRKREGEESTMSLHNFNSKRHPLVGSSTMKYGSTSSLRPPLSRRPNSVSPMRKVSESTDNVERSKPKSNLVSRLKKSSSFSALKKTAFAMTKGK